MQQLRDGAFSNRLPQMLIPDPLLMGGSFPEPAPFPTPAPEQPFSSGGAIFIPQPIKTMDTGYNYSDPSLEVNFSSLTCPQISSLLTYVNNWLASRDRSPEEVVNYYTIKQTQLQALYTSCASQGSPPIPPVQPGGVTDPLSTLPGTTIPQFILPPPTPSNASGAGGSTDKTKKPFCWICLFAFALAAVSIYKGTQ